MSNNPKGVAKTETAGFLGAVQCAHNDDGTVDRTRYSHVYLGEALNCIVPIPVDDCPYLFKCDSCPLRQQKKDDEHSFFVAVGRIAHGLLTIFK